MNQQGRQLLGDPLLAPVTFTPRRQLVPFLRGFFCRSSTFLSFFPPPASAGEVFHPFIGPERAFKADSSCTSSFRACCNSSRKPLDSSSVLANRTSPCSYPSLRFPAMPTPVPRNGRSLLHLFFLRGDLDLGRFHGLPQALPLDLAFSRRQLPPKTERRVWEASISSLR